MNLLERLSRTWENLSRPPLPAVWVVAAGFAVCPSAARAQGGIPLWTNRYDGPGNGFDYADAIAVDLNGNVFVTGYSTGSAGDRDWATIKYSNAGTPLWTNRYNGPGNGTDLAIAIAADANGNAYVAGSSTDTNDIIDYTTIKYSSAGIPLWTNLGPTGQARAIALDGNGNVLVTGTSPGGTSEFATIKYSNAGIPLWTNIYNGGFGNDSAYAIAVDYNGNVFVSGRSVGDGSGIDYATIKYSGAGIPLWTNRYNGPGSGEDDPSALAVDANGDVIVTGTSYFPGNSGYAIATIKYSSAGEPLWTMRSDDWNYGAASAIAVDTNGNVFVTGYASVSADQYGPVVQYGTIAYSSDGEQLWTAFYLGPGSDNDRARGIAVDRSGNVLVTGNSFASGHPTDPETDYVTIAYSNAGETLWISRYDGPGNSSDESNAIAVDVGGNVFVTGNSIGASGDYDYATIMYSSVSLSPASLDFQTSGGQLVLSWANPAFSLQSAPSLTGTFTNVPGAASPFTNAITAGAQFFRLKGAQSQ